MEYVCLDKGSTNCIFLIHLKKKNYIFFNTNVKSLFHKLNELNYI